MSHVTGVVLIFSIAEEGAGDFPKYTNLGLINTWLEERGFESLYDQSKASAGNRHPQIIVCIGGYNYFPEEDFVIFVLSLPWELPENFSLIINPEDGPAQYNTIPK